jgi:lanthanide-dependent methanol dehydrogenase
MPAKNYASTRYSGLAEITGDNVQNLQLAWTFSTGRTSGHEAAPVIAGGTMYVVTPFPNELFALDLTKPGGPIKWRYSPPVLRAARGVACCDMA